MLKAIPLNPFSYVGCGGIRNGTWLKLYQCCRINPTFLFLEIVGAIFYKPDDAFLRQKEEETGEGGRKEERERESQRERDRWVVGYCVVTDTTGRRSLCEREVSCGVHADCGARVHTAAVEHRQLHTDSGVF